MNNVPALQIYVDHAREELLDRVETLAEAKYAGAWRCIYAQMPSQMYYEYNARHIVINFLRKAFGQSDDEIKIFWLKSGDLFILFRGHIRSKLAMFDAVIARIGDELRDFEYDFWELAIAADAFEEAVKKASENVVAIEDRRQQELLLALNLKAENTQEQKLEQVGSVSEAQEVLQKEEQVREKKSLRDLRYTPLLLMVEDDRTTRTVMQALLDPYCNVIAAETLLDAHQLYEQYFPNIVFLDIDLPDGDGQAFLRHLSRVDPEAYVVIVSGNISQACLKQCLRFGAKGFVSKPFNEKQVINIIYDYNKARR